MKPFLLTFSAICLLGSPAYADDASKTAKVEEFFQLAKMDDLLRQTLTMTMNQIKSGIFQQLAGVKLAPDQEKLMDEYQDRLSTVISDALSWEKLKPGYVKLFAEAYTESELDDIVAFYKSPTGRSMVAKTPMLMTKATTVVQAKMQEAMPALEKVVQDFMEQAKKQQ
jgi:uncharacterized protein